MADWNDFYVAVAGASAALTGLIFVGVSISLTKILSIRGLPDRVLLSLVLLLNVLVLSIISLIPGLTIERVDILILVIGAFTCFIVFRLDFRIIQTGQNQHKRQHLFNTLIDQVATICFIVTGIAMMTSWTNGEYWIVPAIFVSIIKAVFDSWALLIEINR